MVAEIRSHARRLRRALRHLLLRADAARVRRPGEGAGDGCASRATSSSADGAVWLRTTDFGDDKDRVLVKADGEPTYFAADCAYYLDKRARGFDKVVIMLGADHSGYVGRYKALVAAAGDDPATAPRDPDRPAGQPGPRRRAGPDEQAGRQLRAAHRPGRRRGHRRGPLRPGPRLGRPADRHRRRPVEPADQRQPGLLRPVRARPHLLGAAQRRRPRARARRGRRRRRRRARARAGERPAARDRRVPAGARRRRRAAGAAPGRPVPRGAGRHLPPLLRLLPRAAARRRGGHLADHRPAVAVRGDRDRAAQRPRRARRAAHRSGCESAPRRPAARQHLSSRPRPVRPPAELGALDPHVWPRSAERVDGELHLGGRAGHRPRPRARHAAVRPRRGRLPRPGRRLRDRLRRRRRALRVQGVPLRPGGPVDRRRRPAPGRLQRQRAGPGPGRRLPGRADRAARQQQVAGRAAAGRRRAGSGTSCVDSFDEIDRLVPLAAGRVAGGRRAGAGAHPRDRRHRGAHPRVHRDRARGPEVRLLAGHRRRPDRGRAG